MARRLTLCAVCSSLPRSVSPAIRSTIMRKRSLRRLPGSRSRPSMRPSWRVSSWYGIITTPYHTRLVDLRAAVEPRRGAPSAFENRAALLCPARSDQVRGIRWCTPRRNIHRKSAEHDIDAVIATSLAQPALVRPVGAIHQPRSGYARVPTGRRRAGRTGCQLARALAARALAERTDPGVRHRRLADVLRERGGWDPAPYLYCCRDDQQNRGRDQLAGWPYLHGLEPDHPPPMVRVFFSTAIPRS